MNEGFRGAAGLATDGNTSSRLSWFEGADSFMVPIAFHYPRCNSDHVYRHGKTLACMFAIGVPLAITFSRSPTPVKQVPPVRCCRSMSQGASAQWRHRVKSAISCLS